MLERLARVARYHHSLLLGTGYYVVSELLGSTGSTATPATSGAPSPTVGIITQSVLLVLPLLALAVDIACVSETDAVLRAGIYVKDRIERVWRRSTREGWESWLANRDLDHRRRTADRLLDRARRGIVIMYSLLSALILGHLLTSTSTIIPVLAGVNPWYATASLALGYALISYLSFAYLDRRRREEFNPFPYDALVLDVDGCLLDASHRVSERNRDALHAMVESGKPVVLASGRGSSSLARIAVDAGAVGWHVAGHGATLVQVQRAGKVVSENLAGLDIDQVREIANEMRLKFPAVPWVAVQADGDHYCRQKHQSEIYRLLLQRRDVVAGPDGGPPSGSAAGAPRDIDALDPSSREVFEKVLLYCNRSDGLDATLRDRLDLKAFQLLRTTNETIEIVSARASKVAGSKLALLRSNVKGGTILACGDQDNDLELLRWAHLGVCPSNASPAVQSLPRVVRLDQSNDQHLVERIATEYFGVARSERVEPV